APAAIDQVAIASGPGRMSLGVDVEGERVPLLTIGRVGFELGAVCHRHLDAMIVGMKIILFLHDHLTPTAAAANSANSCGLSTGNAPVGQAPGPFRIALARRRKRFATRRAARARPALFGCSRSIFCSAGAVLPFWGFSGARDCRRLQALRGPLSPLFCAL